MPTFEGVPGASSSDAANDDARRYRTGVICLVTATVFTSLAGVLVRQVEAAGGWEILFYRSLAFVATMMIFIVIRHRGRSAVAFAEVGRAGLVVAACLTAAFILFIFALLQTTVANVVFTVSLSPFFAALLAWLALRETVASATLVAMALSLCGIGLLVADGLALGTLSGNMLALACCLCYSAALVALRKGRTVDMIPAVCLAGVGTAAVSALMVPTFAISRFDLGIAIILGVVQLAFQYILVTTGTRFVPAAEAALIGRLTLIMAPLWVWLAVGEVPTALSFAGGLIVLLAVTGQGIFALRRNRRALT